MQKISTAKKAEQVLNEEITSSIKKALKDAHFKETEPGTRFAEEPTKRRMKQIGRAEVFKSTEYPEFIGREGTKEEKQVNAKLLKTLEKIAKELESQLGDEFIAISLYGSYAKGYAGKVSDADVMLLLRSVHGDKLWKAYNTTNKLVGGTVDWKVHADFHWLADAKRHIHAVREENGMIIGDMDAAKHVFIFFTGKTFGRGIEGARKELVEELAKSPHGELIWEDVMSFHMVAVVGLLQKGFYIREDEAPEKLGVTVEDFREILQARKKFSLPSFEEMKKKYEVT